MTATVDRVLLPRDRSDSAIALIQAQERSRKLPKAVLPDRRTQILDQPPEKIQVVLGGKHRPEHLLRLEQMP
jgi:hypothetical protein